MNCCMKARARTRLLFPLAVGPINSRAGEQGETIIYLMVLFSFTLGSRAFELCRHHAECDRLLERPKLPTVNSIKHGESLFELLWLIL